MKYLNFRLSKSDVTLKNAFILFMLTHFLYYIISLNLQQSMKILKVA